MQLKDLTDTLGFYAFYEALENQLSLPAYGDMPFQKRVQLLLEAELTYRENKKIIRLQQQAKLQEKSAIIEEIDFSESRSTYKNMILELASGEYLKRYQNIILTGPTGTGKSYIAQALANKAMTQGYSALYLRISRLIQELNITKDDERSLKIMNRLKNIKLLILDDFGVSPLKANEARNLLEIVEDRTNCSSLIITSQLPIKEWHAYLHNATIADAILDRIIHNAHKINLAGESQRKVKKGIKN